MYDYCEMHNGSWVVTLDNMFLAYATDEQDAKKTANNYNKEDEQKEAEQKEEVVDWRTCKHQWTRTGYDSYQCHKCDREMG